MRHIIPMDLECQWDPVVPDQYIDTHLMSDSGSHVNSSTRLKPTHFVKSAFWGIFDPETWAHYTLTTRHYAAASEQEKKDCCEEWGTFL